jgi:hypothetical protein
LRERVSAAAIAITPPLARAAAVTLTTQSGHVAGHLISNQLAQKNKILAASSKLGSIRKLHSGVSKAGCHRKPPPLVTCAGEPIFSNQSHPHVSRLRSFGICADFRAFCFDHWCLGACRKRNDQRLLQAQK